MIDPPLPAANILTFDVEDWYQGFDLPPAQWPAYEDRLHIGLDRILALLAEHEVRATFFLLGCIAAARPALVRRLAEAGHELGTHGWDHTPLYRQTPAQFQRDLNRSLHAIQEAGGTLVRGHRAPFFSVTRQTLWSLQAVAAAGLRYDSSIFPVHNYRYGLPGARRFPHRWPELPLWEFPLSTVAFAAFNIPFSGGFYARFWPYAWQRAAIRHLNRAGQPAILYFHPWEFDPGQPRLRTGAPWLARRTHYHRLHRPPALLRAFLADFTWTSMGDYLAHCEDAAGDRL